MGGASQGGLAQRRVFLNVPYDAGYEQNFLALIAALIESNHTENRTAAINLAPKSSFRRFPNSDQFSCGCRCNRELPDVPNHGRQPPRGN